MNENERVAIAIMRIQPLHEGHCKIIDKMIRDYSKVILCIGSAQKGREKNNPWTFEERKQMVQNVYGDRIKIVQLNDLGSIEGTTDWVDYVLDKIKKIGMVEPTDYFTGSEADSGYYTGRFFLDGVSNWDDSDPFCSKINEKNEKYYVNGFLRQLHILDRERNPIPPAIELRTFLELKNSGWKKWIPAVNWSIVEDNFPEEFQIKYK